MGRKSQETVIGYKNFLGAHLALAVGRIEGIAAIFFDDRAAWEGPVGSHRIRAFAPDLWGGDEREGGFIGHIDYENGASDQGRHDYLQQVLHDGVFDPTRDATYDSTNPGLVPNFLGVPAAVFRRCYWGNVPRANPVKLKLINTCNTHDMWQAGIAGIGAEYKFENTAIYLCFDNSSAMSTAQFEDIRDAIKDFIDLLGANAVNCSLGIKMAQLTSPQEYEQIPFTSANVAAAKAFMDALPNPSDTVLYNQAVTDASGFFSDSDSSLGSTETYEAYIPAASGIGSRVEDIGFSGTEIRRVLVFLADGGGAPSAAESTLDGISNCDRYCVAVHSDNAGNPFLGFGSIQNTEFNQVNADDAAKNDGVPISLSDAGSDGVLRLLSRPFRTFEDLNAAHIIRDVILNPECGGDGDDSVIDDTNFENVANTLFTEGFGLSLRWKSGSTRHEFLRLIEKHIDGVVITDRQTGLFQIKLIRDDYTIGNLTTFNQDNIIDWVEPWERPKPWELPNKVTLKFTDRKFGKTTSTSVINSAGLRNTSGTIVNEPIELLGITQKNLASLVCQREAQARTTLKGFGTIRVAYCPIDLNIGSAIIVDDDRVGISSTVCRILEMKEGDGKDNSVVLKIAEDTSQSLGAGEQFVEDGTADGGQADNTPVESTTIFLEEASYYDQTLIRGQSDIDDDLVIDPDLGNWQITGSRPNALHNSARIVRKDGSDWTTVALSFLMPTWELNADLSDLPTTTSFVCGLTGRENELVAGQRIQINNEIMRLDSVVVDEGAGTATFNVGRGCLDTVPADHLADDVVMAWPRYVGSDFIDYTSGESIEVRLLPQTIGGTLALDDATSQNLTFDSRAIRPYPPGAVQVNSSYNPGAITGVQTVSWEHRDRRSQTTAAILDFTDAGIGPESSTSYHIIRQVIADQGEGEFVSYEDEIAVSPVDDDNETTDLDELDYYVNWGTDRFEISVVSRRDGYECTQRRPVPITPPAQTYAGHFLEGGGVDGTTGSSITVNLPASAQPGDHLFIWLMDQEPVTAPTTPTGWTQIVTDSVSGHNRAFLYHRQMQDGDGPVTINTTDTMAGVMVAARGSTSSGNPVEASSTTTTDPASTSVSIDGLTTLTDNALVIFFLAIDDDDTGLTGLTHAGLADFTSQFVATYNNPFSSSEDVTLALAWGYQTTAGVVGAATGANTLNFAEYQVGACIALENPNG